MLIAMEETSMMLIGMDGTSVILTVMVKILIEVVKRKTVMMVPGAETGTVIVGRGMRRMSVRRRRGIRSRTRSVGRRGMRRMSVGGMDGRRREIVALVPRLWTK